MSSDVPPNYSRPHGPPGTVEVVSEDETSDEETEYVVEEDTHWGMNARISLSPAHMERCILVVGAGMAGVAVSVLLTALVTAWLL